MRTYELAGESFPSLRDDVVQAVHRATARVEVQKPLVQEVFEVAVHRLVRHCIVAVGRVSWP